MATELDIETFIDRSRELPIIDVRSPAEYTHAHIPGAVNLPLFDNDERAEVGTLYKQKGRYEALKRGLDIVGPKMRGFVERAGELTSQQSNRLLVHCWRGGMRSSSMAWLLETAGFSIYTLQGGYKAYRNWTLTYFENPFSLIALGGYTGSGKSELLKQLSKMGEQVIDLESHAHHKGSAFGHLGQSRQPTGEQFENNLAYELARLNPAKPIWVEDESRLIGKRCLPDAFFKQMQQAPLVCVAIPEEKRLDRLVQEYAVFSDEALKQSINNISRRLGGLRTKQALQAIDEQKYREAARITLSYYDKVYQYSLDERRGKGVPVYVIHLEDPEDPQSTELLRDQAYSHIHSKVG